LFSTYKALSLIPSTKKKRKKKQDRPNEIPEGATWEWGKTTPDVNLVCVFWGLEAFLVCLVELGFELRVLHLQDKYSTA
jgi:hypothetical protein